MINRLLDLTSQKHSFFLFGPRQTGKTYLCQHTLQPDLYINLLKHSELQRYIRDSDLLYKEVKQIGKQTPLVVIDEVQKYPALLNEVQNILNDYPQARFALTGSSARKLRKGGVNLLGGRAITLHLHPLTHIECTDSFSLDETLQFGTLPPIFLEKDLKSKKRLLKGYVETYIKEEIQQEALTRNMPAFSQFLELSGFENGNIINCKNISREIGVDAKTIRGYFQILEDTLLGLFLYPYSKSHRDRLISHPKFYLFDPGIQRTLTRQLDAELVTGTSYYGNAFEHWIILETMRLLDYSEIEYKISFFRTQDGMEVNLILELQNKIWVIEIKASNQPSSTSLRGIKSLIKDHPYDRAICVCTAPNAYKEGKIEILPWQHFFSQIRT